jgi:predicted aminopeptidase
MPPWRVAARWIGRALLALLLVAAVYLVATPTGRYVLRAIWAEAGILARRRDITDIIADSSTSPATRRKLQVVLAARAFASESIGLTAKESFTTYSHLDRDTLVLVLSGAYRDRLRPYTWWFPIVGRVPYKGYFDFDGAKKAARDLDARGFDVYLRPSPAFSTLGWFNDPLLSTSLRGDTLGLANTVVHELTHNTFYASGSAVFNESFANFVGARGAAWFFRSRNSPRAADRLDAEWSDDKEMSRFWATLYFRVDSAFRQHPTDSLARLAARDSLYARARRDAVEILGPRLRTIDPRALERLRLDNAVLLAHRIYNTDLDVFDQVWVKEGADLRKTIARVVELAKSRPKDPFGAMKDWVAGRNGVENVVEKSAEKSAEKGAENGAENGAERGR